MNFQEQALKRLGDECKAFKGNKYEEAMKRAVREALESFCRQSEEFAQAVAQGGTFSACMAAVAKGCGSSLSDLEAYRRAAAFYFRDARVEMELRICLEPEEEKPEKVISLNFMDFLS